MGRCRNLLLALLPCFLGAPTPGRAVSSGEAEAWREDLRFVQSEMPAVHPDLFHSLPREAFDASIDTLIQNLRALTQDEIIVELAEIVASIGDGHTRLTLPVTEARGLFTGHSPTPPPSSPSLLFHDLPVRFAVFDDGLFVHEIDGEHAASLGARVERIGNLSVHEAVERVSRVLHRDNEMQVRSLLPSRLVIPELLRALRIVDDANHVELQLSMNNEPMRTLVLEPLQEGAAVDWVNFASLSGKSPLYLRHRDRNFWFEPISGTKMVFCQYNEVYDEETESIAAFSTRLTDFITKHSVRTLVLDLRFNHGGDNSLNRSFLHALIRCSALQTPGSFFVIIGRNTFSAAMMFAIDLEKHTNAIFVGEPTGARPNHYGDSRKLRLPNSGLTLRVSTLYWQYSGPKDDRPWLPPHVPVPFVSNDDRMGRDPALEKIRDLVSTSNWRAPDGRWVGRILNYAIVLHNQRRNGKWEGQIDFPDEGANGLPLTNMYYREGSIGFDFPNGDSPLSFEGAIHGDTIIGRVVLADQIYPWVMTAAN